jgi:hypothetical protein
VKGKRETGVRRAEVKRSGIPQSGSKGKRENGVRRAKSEERRAKSEERRAKGEVRSGIPQSGKGKRKTENGEGSVTE